MLTHHATNKLRPEAESGRGGTEADDRSIGIAVLDLHRLGARRRPFTTAVATVAARGAAAAGHTSSLPCITMCAMTLSTR